MSEQLIIAGFHRSGTSLTAQLLHRSGLFLGHELLGARPSNPYGHFEDADVVEIHEQILSDNDLTWLISEPFLPIVKEPRWRAMRRIVERRNTEHRLWGFKDPRCCMFMMVWKYLLPDAKVLLVYRHFADTTYSLNRRHSSDLLTREGRMHVHRQFFEKPDVALRSWLTHNKALLAFARAYPDDTLVVSADAIQQGFPLLWAIERRWRLGLEDVPVGEVFNPEATARHVGRQPISDRRLIPEIEATWNELETLGRETEQKTMKEAFVAGG